MKCTQVFLLLGLLLAVSSSAEVSVKKKYKLPLLLREVEEAYAKHKTLYAKFSQTTDNVILNRKKTVSGEIFIEKPDRIRWETLKPESEMNLLIGDGKKFYSYTPPFDEGEAGQVVIQDASKVQSKLAHALISGRFSIAKNMRIVARGKHQFTLIPKARSAGTVKAAILDIDPVKKRIEKVTLEHIGGNRAEIKLTEIELGKEISPQLFVFEAPPNTDKVQAP